MSETNDTNLLDVEDLEIIGKGYDDGYIRPDDVKRVTGTAPFSIDQRPHQLGAPKQPQYSDLLEVKLLRSPHAHAKIKRIDASAARSMDGVEAVITGEDALPHPEYVGKTQPQQKKAHYYGDIIAAVAARDELTAQNAVEQIDVEYEKLPLVLTAEDGLEPEEHVYDPERIAKFEGGQAFVDENFPVEEPTYEIEFGDIDDAFDRAAAVATHKNRNQSIKVTQQEPRNVIADWNGQKLTLWATAQNPGLDAEAIAASIGIPADDVRLICPYVGGGFGGNGVATTGESFTVIAATLAKKTGSPVRLEFTRRGETLAEGGRGIPVSETEVAADADGNILGFKESMIWDQGEHEANVTLIAPVQNALEAMTPEATQWEGSQVFTNKVQTYMKGYGVPAQTMARGPVFDELAAELDMDPIEIFKKNHHHFHIDNPIREDYYSDHWSQMAEQMIDDLAEAINWEEEWKPPEERSGRYREGLGFMMMDWQSGDFPREVRIKLDETGAVRAMPDFSNMGCDTYDLVVKAVAEVLELDYYDVRDWSSHGDTEEHGNTGPHVGSSGARSIAGPYKDVAVKLRDKIIDAAADILEVEIDNLTISDGAVVNPETDETLTYEEIAQETGEIDIWHYHEPGEGSRWPFMAATKIEVDTLTGKITPLKLVSARDFGYIVNDRDVVEAQMVGGVIQGLGHALYGEEIYDEETGIALNPDFHGYKTPTHEELKGCEIESLIYESSDSLDDWLDNVAGIGEHSAANTPATLNSAVYNATGVRMEEYPITQDRLLPRLEEEGVGPI